MSHFVTNDQMNIFRIRMFSVLQCYYSDTAISWQYLTNNVIGPLDTKNFGDYDKIMQACIKTGTYVELE